jgi:hypothetical protein
MFGCNTGKQSFTASTGKKAFTGNKGKIIIPAPAGDGFVSANPILLDAVSIFDAESLDLREGDPVNEWQDDKGNMNLREDGFPPVYRENGAPNGKPAVEFNHNNLKDENGVTISDQYSIVIVFSTQEDATMSIFSAPNFYGIASYCYGGTSALIFTPDGGGTEIGIDRPKPFAPFVYGISAENEGARIYDNGNFATEMSLRKITPIDGFTLGLDKVLDWWFIGRVMQVIIWDKFISPAKQQDVAEHMINKWGL